VFEANHIIQVGGGADTSRLSEQQRACLGAAAGRFLREQGPSGRSERDETCILTRARGIFPQRLGDIS
jgi:hypothetical protein